jgi:hypothetical protein
MQFAVFQKEAQGSRATYPQYAAPSPGFDFSTGERSCSALVKSTASK